MIDDYAKIPDRLRAVAGKLVGDSRKELLAIANLIEQSAPELLKPSYSRTLKRRRNRAAKAKLPIPAPGGGVENGAAIANEDRSNDERIEESIAKVVAAVGILSQRPDWEALGRKARARLIAEETRRATGTGTSTQTLYRPWCKDLW